MLQAQFNIGKKGGKLHLLFVLPRSRALPIPTRRLRQINSQSAPESQNSPEPVQESNMDVDQNYFNPPAANDAEVEDPLSTMIIQAFFGVFW